MRLYDSMNPSGNAYKVRLLLSQLGLRCGVTEIDVTETPRPTQTTEFLAKNPHGQIPVLELDDGRLLPESDAILYYLAEGTPYLASDQFDRAQTLRWMFFEQYSHQPYIATLHSWTYRSGIELLRPEAIERLRVRGQVALDLMETHLSAHTFFVAEQYSIADIALYAYTQNADQIGLRTGSAVKSWLGRVRNTPGYVPIKRDPLPRPPERRWA